jgi:23S rRNA (uracil1939-C5)-methyltransferase
MRDPKCPYFALPTDSNGRGKCGGCATQHLEYELQLENKKKRAQQATGFDDIKVFSGEEWFYRNRMDMVFTKNGIGFREKGSWKWKVDVKECVISNRRLNDLITEVWDNFGAVDPFDSRNNTGTYRYAVIRTPENDSSISFVLNKDSSRCGEAVEKIKEFSRKSSANNILVTYVPQVTDVSTGTDFVVIKGSDMLEETFLGKRFRYSAQGFFQNNHEMAENMHLYVNEVLSKHANKFETRNSKLEKNAEFQNSYFKPHLLDLYGGVGTFGIINSDLFKTVKTVESFEGCVEAAKANIELNGVKNTEAILLDAMQLKKLDFQSPLFVVTDPPRSGMHQKTIEQLIVLKPKLIIYISCSIQQLEKELPKFLKHYKLKSAAIFDLFPQTNHMETVVELVKS